MRSTLQPRWQILALTIAIGAFGAACGGGEAEPAASERSAVSSADTTEAPVGGSSTTETSAPDTTTAAEPDGAAREADGLSPGSIEVLDPGEEPRVELTVAESVTGLIDVAVTATRQADVDGEPVDTVSTASYLLSTEVEVAEAEVVANIFPEITRLDTGTPMPTASELGLWHWSLDRNGALLAERRTSLSGTPFQDADALLAAPDLFAVVPSTAVGSGAQWTIDIGEGEVMLVELTSVDDDTIEIVSTIDVETADSATLVQTSGIYRLDSLLVVEAVSEGRVDFKSETTANGEPVAVTGTFSVDRTYTTREQS